MSDYYLGIPKATIDSQTVFLTFETATKDEGFNEENREGEEICEKSRAYWAKVLRKRDLRVTATIIKLFCNHSRGGPNGIAQWVCDNVKMAGHVRCSNNDFQTRDSDDMPYDCGWSYDRKVYSLPQARPRWRELERWIKAALLWICATKTAVELSDPNR